MSSQHNFLFRNKTNYIETYLEPNQTFLLNSVNLYVASFITEAPIM